MAGFSCFAESTLCAGADAGFSAGLAGFESVLSEGAASGAGSALLEVTSLDGFEGFDASAGLGASAAFAGEGSAAGFFGSVEASRSCSAAEDLEAAAGASSGDEAEADLGSTLGGSVANFALSAAFCSAASCASTSLTAWVCGKSRPK